MNVIAVRSSGAEAANVAGGASEATVAPERTEQDATANVAGFVLKRLGERRNEVAGERWTAVALLLCDFLSRGNGRYSDDEDDGTGLVHCGC